MGAIVMTINTLESIMNMLVKFFPNFKFDMEDDLQVELWLGELHYMNDEKAVLAARKVISTCDFVTVKNLKQAYAEIEAPLLIDDEEGWGLVKKAIRNFGYARADEAMNSLPSRVQKAVAYCGGFQAICESEKEDVMRGQFNKAMEAVNNRIRSELTLGAPLLEQIRLFQLEVEQKEHNMLEVDRALRIEHKDISPDVEDKIKSIKEIIESSKEAG